MGQTLPADASWSCNSRHDRLASHYFLHIQDGADFIEDPDRAEYFDVAAAEREAAEDALHVMAECLRWAIRCRHRERW